MDRVSIASMSDRMLEMQANCKTSSLKLRISGLSNQASQILLEIRCFRNPNLANKHRIVRRIYCNSNFAPKIEQKISRRCAKDGSNLYKFVLLKEILKHHSKYKSLFAWRTKITFRQSPDQQSKMEFALRFWTRSILVIHILGHQIACHVRATNFIYSDHLHR